MINQGLGLGFTKVQVKVYQSYCLGVKKGLLWFMVQRMFIMVQGLKKVY